MSLSQNETLAEELTQETFYKAYLYIGKFKGKSTLYAWLCQIAKNLYFNEYKKLKRLSFIDHPMLEKQMTLLNQQADDGDLSSNIIRQETFLQVRHILYHLPEPYKEVFTLRVFGELKFHAIAGLFGKTDSWAKITYYRAKEKIIHAMEDAYDKD